MVQAAETKRVAIYAGVSTADRSRERQSLDLRLLAERMGAVVVAEFTESASGAKNDRKERAQVMKLAQAVRWMRCW
jgi:DNA invertase Pin-like site-specific DNA recombinase